MLDNQRDKKKIWLLQKFYPILAEQNGNNAITLNTFIMSTTTTTKTTKTTNINKLTSKPKRKPTMSQKTKTKANNHFKQDTFSISGLIRYGNGRGKAHLQSYIDQVNKAKDSNVTIGKVLNKGTMIKNAPKGYMTHKDGTKRLQFSYYLMVLNLVTKLANA